jgi:hypothetical protein
MVAAGTARVEVGLKHTAHRLLRMGEVRIEVRTKGRAAGHRSRQADEHPQCCRLAGAVGSEKAGNDTRLNDEAEIADSRLPVEALAQPIDDNGFNPPPRNHRQHRL